MRQTEEGPQRKRRTESTHGKVDFRVPIKIEETMAEDVQNNGDSCFGIMWNMESRQCPLCADNEICGVIYNHAQNKLVKLQERSRPKALDKVTFDTIQKEKIMMWLSTNTRTPKEFIELVTSMSRCDEKRTVALYCKSFIKDSDRLGCKDGVIYVKAKK